MIALCWRAMSKFGKIRIIAGSHKGRVLPAVCELGVRPSKSSVRERQFAWLGDKVRGACVFDVFSGSGVNSVEAISRGADACYGFDQNEKMVNYLLTLSQDFSVRERLSASRWCYPNPLPVHKSHAQADIVFWDAPYGMVCVDEALCWISTMELLTPSGCVVMETEKKEKWESTRDFFIHRQAVSGGVRFGIWMQKAHE